jgi:hypothetical protein
VSLFTIHGRDYETVGLYAKGAGKQVWREAILSIAEIPESLDKKKNRKVCRLSKKAF